MSAAGRDLRSSAWERPPIGFQIALTTKGAQIDVIPHGSTRAVAHIDADDGWYEMRAFGPKGPVIAQGTIPGFFSRSDGTEFATDGSGAVTLQDDFRELIEEYFDRWLV